ncbi:hypothetical protein [Nocardia sp. NPDC060259]|uniref:hypothetical protein n=1 Tax=Nocardia sp. NPDC060259 TaxID=3347088 RepID=UPI00365AE437
MTEEVRKTDPLYRRGLEAAAAYDDAETGQRRKKLLVVFGYGLAMIVEHWIRQGLQQGALLFSVIVAAFGVFGTETSAWRFGLVAAGVAGVALVFVVLRSRWGLLWQHFVPAAVLGADALLLILWNQR